MQAMEEAVPFLKAVDARDVPDYYDVIKVHHRAQLLCSSVRTWSHVPHEWKAAKPTLRLHRM